MGVLCNQCGFVPATFTHSSGDCNSKLQYCLNQSQLTLPHFPSLKTEGDREVEYMFNMCMCLAGLRFNSQLRWLNK